MKKYKSLLYREWKLASKHYCTRAGLFLLFAVLAVFICMFLEGLEFFEVVLAYLGATLAATLASEDSGVFASDMNSDWMQYSYALPVTGFDKAVARYILKLITIVVGMVIAIACAAGLCTFGNSSISTNMVMHFFFIMDVILVYDMLVEALVLRANSVDEMKKMNMIVWGVMMCIILVVPKLIPTDNLDQLLLVIEENLTETGSPQKILEALTPLVDGINAVNFLAIPIMLVLLVIGFIFTWKNFERRGA